ncbi:MAG: hypothetical protein Q9162_001019 [Coniocarpon cinnabarinum]
MSEIIKWFEHPWSTKFIDADMHQISDDSDGELPVYIHSGNESWLSAAQIESNKKDWIEKIREEAPSKDDYHDDSGGHMTCALIRGKATLGSDKKASVYYLHHKKNSPDWHAGLHKHIELDVK